MSEDQILKLVRAVFEGCAKIAEGERVESAGNDSDIAYNRACDHIAAAIREAKET